MLLFILTISLFGLFYVYLGYPLVALALARLRADRVKKQPFQPRVTIIIAAYNEAASIAATIENKLALNYSREKLDIIVISDGSTDGTDGLVEQFAGRNVSLLRQEPRAGKTSALNLAVPQARGDILVFSDANSLYDQDALNKLVANFADVRIGYVTGKMIYTEADGTLSGDGCSAYMRYENVLRGAETDFGSIVGVDGGIDAMRRSLYRPMKADQLPDFVQPLMVVAQGYRVVYEPEALLKEPALGREDDEYRMRVRVALRALWALYDMRQLLFFPTNRLFSWQLWSHKVLRYLCFFFLFGAFFSNLFLLDNGGGYVLLFVLQCLGYVLASIAPNLQRRGIHSSVITFIRYFVLLNLACAHAFGKFISGHKQILWTPRKG